MSDAWLPFLGLIATYTIIIVGAVRYFDAQIARIERLINDRISIGEYTRRHDDLERRLRSVERWQDHANGSFHRE